MDPGRKSNHPRLLALLRRLAEMTMVVGVRRKKSCVGMLFVAKKTGALRMIIDRRQPNSFHRAPPHATMASVASLASVTVGQAWGDRADVGSGLWAGSVDLKDGFHQFLNYKLAEWFLFDIEGVRAGDLNLTEVVGEGGRIEAVGPEEFIWPAYGGMAMGWSWALWVCHETVVSVTKDVGDSEDVWLLDKQPVPALPPFWAWGGRLTWTTPT